MTRRDGLIRDPETKPTAEDRRDGFKHKYNITHADGSPVDSDGKYFVLRLDYHEGCDRKHIAACQQAALYYAQEVRNHLPVLSADLRRICTSNRPPAGLTDEEMEAMANAADIVAKQIRAHAEQSNGQMDCPICGEGTVHYRIASNGHVAARCTTNHCVSFQE